MKIISRIEKKAVIYYNNEFYLVSEANNMLTGFRLETLIFRCDPTGEVSEYFEVGGGKYLTLDDVLENIDEHLYKQER
jgi:hypothetical protein